MGNPTPNPSSGRDFERIIAKILAAPEFRTPEHVDGVLLDNAAAAVRDWELAQSILATMSGYTPRRDLKREWTQDIERVRQKRLRQVQGVTWPAATTAAGIYAKAVIAVYSADIRSDIAVSLARDLLASTTLRRAIWPAEVV